MKTRILLSLLATFVIYSCQGISEIAPFDEARNESTPLTRSINESHEYYYWYDGVKIPLIKNENKFYIIVTSDKYKSIENSIRSSVRHVKTIDDYASLAIKNSRSTDKSLGLTAFTTDSSSSVKIEQDDIVYCAPYFKASNGSEIGITNIISVQITGDQNRTRLQKIAEECNLEILGENKYNSSIYYLSCSKESKGNALEMANYIYESGICTYAEPEFLIESEPATYPNDTYFYNQWNLLNNTYPDYDINYVKTIEDFSFQNIDDIIVAVIDNGIYDNHSDLPLYDVSFDAHYGNIPSALYGSHGTMVAGIIGATSNNNSGIAGIASGIKIMPISVCYSADVNLPGNPIYASTSTSFANAIYTAAGNGASIINNSWNFSFPTPLEDINSAINYVLSQGCVVVFASGNNDGTVSQPAADAPANTLVVGAIDQFGDRSDFSNYGSALDLVAPGNEIWTTTWTGEYGTGNGTSFAAPHVSAIAGLMISVNPSLSNIDICNILESTAQKLDDYVFSATDGRENGTWNNEVGYGLVNCYEAVWLAKGYYNLISFDYSGEDISFSITADKDIAVIWDWETEDITEVEISSSTTHTFTHTFSTAETRRIYIAEMIDFETDEVPLSSTAVTGFNLTTGNYASNFEFRPINEALTDIQIIGGFNFESQDMLFSQLPALESLYLINVPNADVTLDNCPELTVFSTSRFIWYDWSEIQTPYVIGPVYAWPTYPESVTSLMSLEINDCPSIHTLSLENIELINLSFEGLPQLEYVYLSSQSSKIVGKTDNYFSTEGAGAFLKDAINTLPAVTGITPGILIIRCVADNNLSFIPVSIASGHLNTINTVAEERNWDIIWD